MFTTQEQQEIQIFLALLFPWGDGHKDLWKSVTWTFVNQEGELGFASYAAQSMPDLIRLIETRTRRPSSNVYVALGTQRVAMQEKKTADGFPKASRTYRNIVSFNSLFMDIDVGKPGAYATTAEALDAVKDFCEVTGMVLPTFEVLSGTGGLHVYWCFDRPVPFEDWKPLAVALQSAALTYKLKFDPQVTVDAARILRVPNTFNHKKTPALKVQLNWAGRTSFKRYAPDEIAQALSTWVIAKPSRQGTNQRRNTNFTAGVENAPPVSIDDVAVNCPAISDILARGGNGDAEPLWNLSLYAASFTSNPHDAAHRLGDQDPRYDHDATEKKLIEKINARANNADAGWPTCQSFNVLHPACVSCPFLTQGKTPFHHARRSQPQPLQFQPAGNDPLMPPGYWRDSNGHVLTTLYDKQGNAQIGQVINYRVVDAGIDINDQCLLRFEAVIGGADCWCEVDVGTSMQPIQTGAVLAKNGIFINPNNHKAARDFLVSWVQHLQTIKRYANQSAYGWTEDGKSFAFDDRVYHDDGTVDLVYRGRRHNRSFMATGDIKPWQDAMQLIYGNAPLEATVATAFAAPLVELVGTASLVVSLYSSLSGIGKSTAMTLAQAVWGHPRTGMSTLSDTTNAMMKKIGDLKNLPVYWDELRTKDQLEKVIEIVFQVTQGKGKARMNKDTSLADVASFTTLFVVASNHGIGDTVYHQTESTEAGGLRLFELQALKLTPTMPDHDARQLLIPLQTNYGVAGALFAEKLAQEKPMAVQALKRVAQDLHQRHTFDSKERFWAMTMSTLLVGAALANHWGIAKFDLTGLKTYLDVALAEQRGEMQVQEYATMVATQDVAGLMHEILLEARNKGLIITETIPYATMGKPLPATLVDTDMSRVDSPWIWMGKNDGRVRARARMFNDWLRKRRLNPRQIIDSLRGQYHITQSKQTIGTGVVGLDALARFGRHECYDFTPITSPAPSPDSDEQS